MNSDDRDRWKLPQGMSPGNFPPKQGGGGEIPEITLGPDSLSLTSIFDTAVAVERGRCAKVAENLDHWHENSAHGIAEAIRKGE